MNDPELTDETFLMEQRDALQKLVERGDLQTVLACLAQDVAAYHTGVVAHIQLFGLMHPAMAHDERLMGACAAATRLRALVWTYVDLLKPLADRLSKADSDPPA